MKRSLLVLVLLPISSLGSDALAQNPAPNPFKARTEPDAEVTYRNPVIPGFYSDPSVVRVGEDYYLVTSTFEYFPGIPVFHSRDLVNWEQIGHAIHRPGQLPEGVNIFACTIRYHDGTFYVITTNVGRGGNFIVTATDPAGPWSDPLWVGVQGIDPDLFFDDDGKTYVISSTFELFEIDPRTGRLLSEGRKVWASTGGRYAEGPHLYKKDGWYYLMAAEGGTEEAHSETIARSNDIRGPYYSNPANPILAHANAAGQQNPIQGVGHADMIAAHDGSWWIVFHGYRSVAGGGVYTPHHTLGRETCLAPVSWPRNGWPQVNGNGTVTVEMTVPTLPLRPFPEAPARVEFDKPLGLEWNYIQYPEPGRYALDQRPGFLRLTGAAAILGEGGGSPTFVGRRLQHLYFTATTRVAFDPTSENEEAGMVLLNNGTHFDLVIRRSNGNRVLVARLEFGTIIAESEEMVLAPGPVNLRIDGARSVFRFSYAQGDADYRTIQEVSARYLSSETIGGFTGTYVGLYATGNGRPSAAAADYDWFEYVVNDPPSAPASGARSDQTELRLARIFGDGMVLQRDAAIPVWGWAAPGADVSVTLAGRTAHATAGSDGAWRVVFPAMTPAGPHTLIAQSGEERIAAHDILVGDVWVASGQSNMEMAVAAASHAEREIAAANDRLLRHFKVPLTWSWEPEDDLEGGSWTAADPEHVGAFTAVGYFFARALRDDLRVPIGIVNTSWGGSAIEAWTSRGASQLDDAAWAEVVKREETRQREDRQTLLARIGTLPTEDQGLVDGVARWADPALDDTEWATIPVPGLWEEAGYPGMDGVAWYRTTFTLTAEEATRGVRLAVGAVDDEDITWVNGVEVGRMRLYDTQRLYDVPAAALREGPNVVAVRVLDTGGGGGIWQDAEQVYLDVGGTRRALAGRWKFKVGMVAINQDGQRINKIPTLLYNRMIHPLLPFPIKGVIWYQGESNADSISQAAAYRAQFATLIRSWRREWGSQLGDFPFLWVQLPNYGTVDAAPPARSAWATMRESQTAALALPKTGQAVIIDIGEPGDIHPRNKQDVGARLALVARSVAFGERVVSSGPTYRGHAIRAGQVEIRFDHADGGLLSRAAEGVVGFAVAGADRQFVWAKARIEGNRVVVWSDQVPEPVAVRYGWSDSPPVPSLYNGAGLPAAPFRTDTW